MAINYSAQQKEIIAKVRSLLTDLLACSSSAQMNEEHLTMLKDTIRALEDIFLVVVVGEFNVGKSSFINALLDTEALAEGVTPTTDQINLIRFSETESNTKLEDWGLLIQLPAELLKSMSFVDTPGTNAVINEHEVLTKWFLPRADMVLFLTSCERPFSESESCFMRQIADWGKKTVIVLNKIDMFDEESDRQKVIEFVKEQSLRMFKTDIPVLPVSARLAKKSRKTASAELWNESGFAALESFIQEKMDERARFQMKMNAALKIGAKISAITREQISGEVDFYLEDSKLAESIAGQVELYRGDMLKEIDRSMKEINAIFAEIRERGRLYFEELFRVKNLPNMVRKDQNRIKFQEDVLQNLPTEVERKTAELVEMITLQQQRMINSIGTQIEMRKSKFPGTAIPQSALNERSELLQRMQSTIDSMLLKIESDIAMNIGMKHAQAAVTAGLAIEVSAIGIGAAVTAITTTVAADLLGIVAAFWVAVAGFLVLPYYKKKSIKEFDERINEIESKLVLSLRNEFTKEVQDQTEAMNQAQRPFERFVFASLESSNKQLAELDRIDEQIRNAAVSIGG